MRFLVDRCAGRQLADWLREKGYDVNAGRRDDHASLRPKGTAVLLRREDVLMAEVESIAHGTTLVTNTVIERSGANTGMLVTLGFRDILDMDFEQAPLV